MLEQYFQMYPELAVSQLINVLERRPFTEEAGFPTPPPPERVGILLSKTRSYLRSLPTTFRYPGGPALGEEEAFLQELQSRVPNVNVDSAQAAAVIVELLGPGAAAVLRSSFPREPITGALPMSFIGDLIGGIGDAAKAIGGGLASAAGAVVAALPSIAQGAATAASAVNAIQMSLSGNPTLPVNPTTGSPMAMPSMAMNPLAQYSAALAAECGAMPTPQCGANFDARLQAFTAALGGQGMTMPINPMTGTPNVVGAGVATDLVALARQGLMNPNVIAALRAVGLGGLIGAGEAGVTALANAAFGGGAVAVPGVRGPLLMQWPAGTPYPRGIVLRAPDKPEKGYRSKGSALLLSGDVAAVRRVQKAATRARRGRRSTRSSARTVYALPAPGAHHVCGSCLSSPCGCSK